MPGKTGLEVCKEVREAGRTVPILILSVIAETTTKVSALNGGADDYLQKPFAAEELVARFGRCYGVPRRLRAIFYRSAISSLIRAGTR